MDFDWTPKEARPKLLYRVIIPNSCTRLSTTYGLVAPVTKPDPNVYGYEAMSLFLRAVEAHKNVEKVATPFIGLFDEIAAAEAFMICAERFPNGKPVADGNGQITGRGVVMVTIDTTLPCMENVDLWKCQDIQEKSKLRPDDMGSGRGIPPWKPLSGHFPANEWLALVRIPVEALTVWRTPDQVRYDDRKFYNFEPEFELSEHDVPCCLNFPSFNRQLQYDAARMDDELNAFYQSITLPQSPTTRAQHALGANIPFVRPNNPGRTLFTCNCLGDKLCEKCTIPPYTQFNSDDILCNYLSQDWSDLINNPAVMNNLRKYAQELQGKAHKNRALQMQLQDQYLYQQAPHSQGVMVQSPQAQQIRDAQASMSHNSQAQQTQDPQLSISQNPRITKVFHNQLRAEQSQSLQVPASQNPRTAEVFYNQLLMAQGQQPQPSQHVIASLTYNEQMQPNQLPQNPQNPQPQHRQAPPDQPQDSNCQVQVSNLQTKPIENYQVRQTRPTQFQQMDSREQKTSPLPSQIAETPQDISNRNSPGCNSNVSGKRDGPAGNQNDNEVQLVSNQQVQSEKQIYSWRGKDISCFTASPAHAEKLPKMAASKAQKDGATNAVEVIDQAEETDVFEDALETQKTPQKSSHTPSTSLKKRKMVSRDDKTVQPPQKKRESH